MKATLGKCKDGKFKIDLLRLIETRMLIQANSGGGKSYAIRKLLEKTHGKVHQIVLDVEGEFSSLGTNFDYILCGKDKDVPVQVRTAELLARKLLELRVSAVVDLYDLKNHERHQFIKLFLESLMNAPKRLWHPTLIVVDEAHIFAPEKGKSVAMNAVIDLATRGRKREFAAVLATQRISKLSKDAAAECLNKLIGRTALDIDMKRAADDLGLTSKVQMRGLRDLEPGHFFAFGPAMSKGVVEVKINKVKTMHGRMARRIKWKNKTPRSKIKKALSKLVDLPKEAEQELHDSKQMRIKIKKLEQQIRQGGISKADKDNIFLEGYQKGKLEVMAMVTKYKNRIMTKLNEVVKLVSALPETGTRSVPVSQSPVSTKRRLKPVVSNAKVSVDIDQRFGKCEKSILGFLVYKNGEPSTKVQIGAMTGYSHGSGGFNNAICKLAKEGLIVRSGQTIIINLDVVDEINELVDGTVAHKLEDWIAKLGACERKIYEELLNNRNSDWTKIEMAEATGYAPGSGGFNNAICRLKTIGLLVRNPDKTISFNQDINV